MDILNGFFIIILLAVFVMMTMFFSIKYADKNNQQTIIYKYLPRTLVEEEESPVYVSEIYKAMFSQPSTWIDSLDNDAIRRQENLNKYFLSQM